MPLLWEQNPSLIARRKTSILLLTALRFLLQSFKFASPIPQLKPRKFVDAKIVETSIYFSLKNQPRYLFSFKTKCFHNLFKCNTVLKIACFPPTKNYRDSTRNCFARSTNGNFNLDSLQIDFEHKMYLLNFAPYRAKHFHNLFRCNVLCLN